MRILFAAAIVCISFPAYSAPSISADKKIKNMNAVQQCLYFGDMARNKIKDNDGSLRSAINSELKDIIDEKYHQAIKNRQIEIGMNICALIASIGKPHHINTTHSSYGTRTQAVYSSRYVYLENGVVTGWQD